METEPTKGQPGAAEKTDGVPRIPGAPASWGATGPANARRYEPTAYAESAPPLVRSAQRAGGLSARAVFGIAAAAAVVAGVTSGLMVGLLMRADSEDDAEQLPRSTESLTVEQTSAIADTAAKSRPSVVKIESTRRTASGGTEQDVGSGVILDTEGHVVTNAHVVLNTDTLKVLLADGTERPAILVGHDYPFSDVAVLQIGPGGLKPMELGDSAALHLGETVVAVGNPLAEFEGSITVGVVSGLNRVRTIDGVRQVDLVQTDAAVNNGNSGGALVNLRGQFVGMPTAVIRQSRSGQVVEGIAFALPSNRVMEIANVIIREGGQYPRPSIRAEHTDLTPEVLAKLSRPGAKEGALIGGVAPGGPAAEAGIQTGDIITRLGDHDINLENPLFNVLMRFEAGQTTRVVFNRNGRIIEAEVRFALRS